ncbi:MAG: cobaltochelatase subunit CobN [Rikenellaceae bacterium]|nr:cobaltochelatase subunit CobN [Rikenellaceae bacterium]
MKITKRRCVAAAIVLVLAAALAAVYVTEVAPTRVAMLNFPDFTVEKMIRSNDNRFIRIESVPLDRCRDIEGYDLVLVRVHGTSLTAEHLTSIERAIERGVAVFATESDNDRINSLGAGERAYFAALMDNESAANFRSLLGYARRHIDGKRLFDSGYGEPVQVPSDYFFHTGEDNFFATYEQYLDYYRASGRYREGAPRVALLAGNVNMQNSNPEHFEALIEGLEARGLNVFPISSFGEERLKMLEQVRPDVIVNRPHGRLVMGGGEDGVQLLKRLGAPVMAPVTVSEPYDSWIESAQGMSGGGMTTMSVVMPELDGAIAPFAVAAQFNRGGLNVFDAIPGHTDRFCSLVERFARLRRLDNKDKKVAIYYYKGNGKGALSAADIEGLPSLYNTLRLLRREGYDVSGLPEDAGALGRMIQSQGAVLGPYALGAFDEFVKNGNPELVPADTFETWAAEVLPARLREQMRERYGEAPGDYMGVDNDNGSHLAVARLRFGNVVILPQPLPAVGDDVDKIVHGVEGAPAYPYVASYLWVRKGFGADAVVHFGTHGSLEFIPGKQVALSDYDWSDVLIGDMPNFYIYTIGNIGEGIIAKRRTYATLIDHLTSPFMQSELYDDLRRLKERIDRFESAGEGPVREGYRATVTGLAAGAGITSALEIDSTRLMTDGEIERVHIYLEEVDGAKVADGLYTLGQSYSAENGRNTARAMSLDPVRYALASIDVAHGRINRKSTDNALFMKRRYGAVAERIIARALAGESPDRIFGSVVAPSDRALYDKAKAGELAAQRRRQAAMRAMMAASTVRDTMPRFLDEHGRVVYVPQGKTEAQPSMMARMAQSEPVSMSGPKSGTEELVSAVGALKEAIEGVRTAHDNLLTSTRMEQQSLIRALEGGYIAPSSAGDPIVNPAAVPTGRNFYSINPEATPSQEAWSVGRRLAESLLESELERSGAYPRKVSFTLWSTDFISSEGATVAQILYLLGVEPLRDGFGNIRSLRLIPEGELGRPRIDVVVQTSGQLRDIASSRLALIDRAVRMAAQADDKGDNYVREGLIGAERLLLERGFSPADARRYSSERVFGGAGGSYGTGIMGMVESGDSWSERSQIARRYIDNMGAIYSSDGGGEWGAMYPGVFEAALLNTSVVVQPRSGNTWGPLSLDHVYEFMGGLSAAVESVTGNDPAAYFNDFRNMGRPKVQTLKESIGVEVSSTVFNPKYVGQMMKGGAGSMEHFAETFRNTYGWNAMKPSAIDRHIWDSYYDIYVKDRYGMGIEQSFRQKNPYALQEMTAVMLEAARKGMWQASDEQVRTLADLHASLVVDAEAGCSGFVCDNAHLRRFISEKVSPERSRDYNKGIDAARQVSLSQAESAKGMVLRKETSDSAPASEPQGEQRTSKRTLPVMLAAVAALFGLLALKRRKRR